MKIEGFSIKHYTPFSETIVPLIDLKNVAELVVTLCELESKCLSSFEIKVDFPGDIHALLRPHMWGDKLSHEDKIKVIYEYFVAERCKWDTYEEK